jgi:PAS domain-containing protein
MHYLGMAALGDHTEIVWIPGYVFASVLLSVAFSVVSLLLARRGDTPRQLAAASVFLTLAIVSLHFVPMSAIDTIRARTFIADGDLLPQHAMAWVVAAIATTVVVGGWIGAMSDRWAGRIIDERSMQLDAAVNNMAQGLCMFDHNGRLQLWNDTYLRIYRLPREEIFVGCDLEHLYGPRPAPASRISSNTGSRCARRFRAKPRAICLPNSPMDARSASPLAGCRTTVGFRPTKISPSACRTRPEWRTSRCTIR